MSNNIGPVTPVDRWAEAVQDAAYTNPPRAIMIDDGVVTVEGSDGNAETLPLAAGVWHPMKVVEIVSATTTATTVWVGW